MQVTLTSRELLTPNVDGHVEERQISRQQKQKFYWGSPGHGPHELDLLPASDQVIIDLMSRVRRHRISS